MRIFVHPFTEPARSAADEVRDLLPANGFNVVLDEPWRGDETIIYVTKTNWNKRTVTIGTSTKKVPITQVISELKKRINAETLETGG